ncbi:hypothetical protein PGQ11_010160 [Apiospora arundinis]|uniref:Uncharacterized protein n=1 Tax=Apiospora arundinis TaxID=335852 RepID=A0ABR2I913_9PEZI
MSSAAATPAKTHPDHVSEREIDGIALAAVFTILASILVAARFIARKWTPGGDSGGMTGPSSCPYSHPSRF